MSKLLGFNLVLIIITLGVAIAALVFSILTFNKVNTEVVTPVTPVTPSDESADCPAFADISQDEYWKEAANRILATADLSIDPCDDFYQFSCGKYLQDTDLEGQSRKGTYDEAQYQINLGLANYLESTTLTIPTEQYQKNFLEACVAAASSDPTDAGVRTKQWSELGADLILANGFPLVGQANTATDLEDLFFNMGSMERLYTGGPLMTSMVTADFKNNETNALYINQPALHFARDYFVKPQFISNLQSYTTDMRDVILSYARDLSLTIDRTFCPEAGSDEDCAQQVAEWAVNLERSIAMASWPDTELRNYKQQYTPFASLDDLQTRFKQLKLDSYVRALLRITKNESSVDFNVVLSQPTYFAALDGLFDSNVYTIDNFANYIAIHFLMENAQEVGIVVPSGDGKKKQNKFDKYLTRRGHGARRISRRPLNARGLAKSEVDEIRTGCIDTLIDYMPYGPGYTYVRNRSDRDKVREDVQKMTEGIIGEFSKMLNSLQWIDEESLARAHSKSDKLVRNYLWPDFFGDFKDTSSVDDYNTHYSQLTHEPLSMWDGLKQLKTAFQLTEQFDILEKDGDRTNFLSSPATVNAWYQPERNSITFPFGILNPPYYNLQYPQAYNYAGQGGTAGHELTHGYDDEGTQFDEYGMLADCQFTHCSILDDSSRSGFVDMAQCVVQQYNTNCCPLKKGNVRCANGDTTQGENIADIGGQQAAYRAYNQLMADRRDVELRLPGLEKYTPNQIFWLTYGVSWCMKITDDRLTKQLMTDPHAPSSCRVNQVMQDIPQFGMDFKCKRGVSTMYPTQDDRCLVWIGF